MKRKSTAVNGFNHVELERCLLTPTPRILERHDYGTILDFFNEVADRTRPRLVTIAPNFTQGFLKDYLLLNISELRHGFQGLSCFQCVLDLGYTPQEASILIETLSNHRDNVLDRLNRVHGLPSYRFTMREACIKFPSFVDFL